MLSSSVETVKEKFFLIGLIESTNNFEVVELGLKFVICEGETLNMISSLQSNPTSLMGGPSENKSQSS